MPPVEDIARIREQAHLSEDETRKQIYELRVTALLGVINGRLIGRSIERNGVSFRINSTSVTPAIKKLLGRF